MSDSLYISDTFVQIMLEKDDTMKKAENFALEAFKNLGFQKKDEIQGQFSYSPSKDISLRKESQEEIDLIIEIMHERHGVEKETLLAYQKEGESLSAAASRMVQEIHDRKKKEPALLREEKAQEQVPERVKKRGRPRKKEAIEVKAEEVKEAVEDANHFWEGCIEKLKKKYPEKYDTPRRIGDLKALSCEIKGKEVYLISPKEGLKGLVELICGQDIRHVMSEALGQSVTLEFKCKAIQEEGLVLKSEINQAEEEIQIQKETRIQQQVSVSKIENVTYLPICPDGKQAIPNAILRSALFAAVKRRRWIEDEIIVSISGVQIRFRGQQLNQNDMEVWQHAITLMRDQTLGNKVKFSANSFLKALGKERGGKDHLWLKKTFWRLAGALVDIRIGDKAYFGTLIEGGIRNENTNEYEISLNPKLINIFDAGWTQIAFIERKKLKEKLLAQWLYGFYFSHAEPHPMKVETIYALSGSLNRDISDFKRTKLKSALNSLQEIGFLESWQIKNNLVYVVKNISTSSQRRFLSKKS